MSADTAVTVVVPTFNRAASLERLLTALEDLAEPTGGFEVIVVDDGSSDDTRHVVERTRFRYLRQENAGAAAARNAGWRAANSDVIAFTDDDTLPTSTWLIDLLAPFSSPDVAGVGGRIVSMFDAPLTAFVKAERLVDHGLDEEGNVKYLITANAAYRRDVLDRVGGFDTAFPGAAGEDVDLSLRVANHGRLVSVDGAVVAHDHRVALRPLLRTYYGHGAARALLASKHPSLGAADASQALLRPSTWHSRYTRYREETGSRSVALGFTVLRVVGVLSFASGFLRARRRFAMDGVPASDVVLLNDVGDVGGGQQVTLDVAIALRSLGWRPLIASPIGWLSQQAADHGVNHVPFDFSHRRLLASTVRLPLPRSWFERLREAGRVRRLMRSSGASALHTVATLAHVVGAMAAIGMDWRLVWHVNQVHPRLLAVLPRPSALIGPSSAALSPLLWRLGDRAHVVPNAVDRGRFRPPDQDERGEARLRLGVADGQIVVFTACRLEPDKGVHHLVSACAGIEGVVLVVAGAPFGASSGEAHVAELRSEAARLGVDLRILGARSDVHNLLWAADIAASGSTYEAFGLFLAEAATAGVPTLAFSTGGVPEVVDDGRTGLLVQVGDVQALRERLLELTNSAELRARLSTGAIERAATHFDTAQMRNALAGVYPPRTRDDQS